MVPDGDDRSTVVWTTDILPDDLAPRVAELMDHGIGSIKQTLESQPAPA